MKKLALLATILFFSVAGNAQSTAKEKDSKEQTTSGPIGGEKMKSATKNSKAVKTLLREEETSKNDMHHSQTQSNEVKRQKAEDPDQGGEIIKKKNVSVKKN